MAQAQRPRLSKRAIALIVVVVVAGLLLSSARFFTDILWFKEVGISSVLWTSLRAQFLVGLVVGVLTAVVVLANLLVAERLAPAYRIPVAGREDPFDRYRTSLRPFARWISVGIATVIGIGSGFAASTAWQTVLLWMNRSSFGTKDPQFGKDVGFYVFQLPFLQQVSDWFWVALMVSTVVTVGAHYFYGSLRPEMGWRAILPGALAHISVLLGLLALVKAFQYWLGTYYLNFSSRGTVTGASYTDVHAQLPALRVLAIISIFSALLFLVNIAMRRLSLPLAAVGIWIFFAVVAGAIWPLAVQRFSVEPQEPQREREFILRNLKATREAFALDDVNVDDFSATSDLSADEVKQNEDMLQNVRLWDPSVLEKAYTQLQAIRTYYQFKDVDIDRYEVEGEKRQVLLAARELSLEDLPSKSKTWQNLHLQYTHGFGLVASLANESSVAGQPSFLVRNVPGTVSAGSESLEAEQARIYYGEGFQPDEYSVVNSKQQELDYALEEGGVQRSSYEGAGGIGVGSIFRRLAFAVREADPNLLLSGLIKSDSKILIYRNVRDRVLRAAPFLDLDQDPYPAVVDDRLVWILDGYTSTRFYPYSERFDAGDSVNGSEAGGIDSRINYIRNSVKIVVDAYDGTMKFYVVDPDDPLIQTWRKAFPSLFTDEEPSEELKAHFRYPEDLFRIQTEVYSTYHMTDPLDFYSKEDAWDIPEPPTVQGIGTTVAGDLIAPVYLLFRPPGDTEQEFVLTRPYTPRGRDNMISFMLARSDPENYGDLASLQFPRSLTVQGPQQVDNLINQDVSISQTLSLLNQRGSTVQFGSLVVLPIETAIMYIQPLFVTAENVGIPELKKVVVVLGEKVVMEDSFDAALTTLFDLDETPDVGGPEASPSPTPEGSPGPDEGSGKVNQRLAALIKQADGLYQRAQRALANGDFATYGRLIKRLGAIIAEAQDLTGR